MERAENTLPSVRPIDNVRYVDSVLLRLPQRFECVRAEVACGFRFCVREQRQVQWPCRGIAL
jgi:hypothetical protein